MLYEIEETNIDLWEEVSTQSDAIPLSQIRDAKHYASEDFWDEDSLDLKKMFYTDMEVCLEEYEEGCFAPYGPPAYFLGWVGDNRDEPALINIFNYFCIDADILQDDQIYKDFYGNCICVTRNRTMYMWSIGKTAAFRTSTA